MPGSSREPIRHLALEIIPEPQSLRKMPEEWLPSLFQSEADLDSQLLQQLAHHEPYSKKPLRQWTDAFGDL